MPHDPEIQVVIDRIENRLIDLDAERLRLKQTLEGLQIASDTLPMLPPSPLDAPASKARPWTEETSPKPQTRPPKLHNGPITSEGKPRQRERRQDRKEQLLGIVMAAGKSLTTKQVLSMVHVTEPNARINAIQSSLSRMVSEGLLKRSGRGSYSA